MEGTSSFFLIAACNIERSEKWKAGFTNTGPGPGLRGEALKVLQLAGWFAGWIKTCRFATAEVQR